MIFKCVIQHFAVSFEIFASHFLIIQMFWHRVEIKFHLHTFCMKRNNIIIATEIHNWFKQKEEQ